MALTYSYEDKYLAKLITEELEDSAAGDVDVIATFSSAWLSKLVPLRAYILLCMRAQTSADDVFASKLAVYRKEWAEQLANAKTNTLDADSISLNTMSVRIGRA